MDKGLIYRGQGPKPKHKHGESLTISGVTGKIQYRELRNSQWWYGILPDQESGVSMILWATL